MCIGWCADQVIFIYVTVDYTLLCNISEKVRYDIILVGSLTLHATTTPTQCVERENGLHCYCFCTILHWSEYYISNYLR